jgi:hypothetical protein
MRKFFAPAGNQRLPPGGMGVGQAVLTVEAVPRSIGLMLAPAVPQGSDPSQNLVLAHISPVGRKAGSDVTGAPVDVPIELCNHCLAPALTACPPPMGTTVLMGNPCNPAQDQSVTCCRGATGAVCGASLTP